MTALRADPYRGGVAKVAVAAVVVSESISKRGDKILSRQSMMGSRDCRARAKLLGFRRVATTARQQNARCQHLATLAMLRPKVMQ